MKFEIALLLYNRPEHSRATIESLIANGVKSVKAFLDFPRDPKVAANQKVMKDYISSLGTKIQIDMYEHKVSMGLRKSVIFALNTLFETQDAVLLLEDDCVNRQGAYDFFLKCLHEFKENKQIRSICGYLPPELPFQTIDNNQLLLMSRFSTWGWATWADRWKEYQMNVRDVVDQFKQRYLSIQDFAPDLYNLCQSEKYLRGEVDVWSIPWSLLHYLSATYVIYPSHTVIDNIGLDGSGRNCVYSKDYQHNDHESFELSNLTLPRYHVINEQLLKEFMHQKSKQIYPNF